MNLKDQKLRTKNQEPNKSAQNLRTKIRETEKEKHQIKKNKPLELLKAFLFDCFRIEL